MPFEKLGLHPEIARSLKAMNFSEATPIQAQAVPVALEGRDVLGGAQTGSGKTAAFVLPMLHHFLSHPKPGLRGLVLVPTRELAVQVEKAVRDYSRYTPVKAAVVIGGVGHEPQRRSVREGAQILVATPGRLLDHLEQGSFRLDRIDHLVLDEADRMLDMGFLPDIKDIIHRIPRERQTLLFSATLHSGIEKIAAFAMRNPVRVEIAKPTTVAEGISQIVYPVIQSQKIQLLLKLLENGEMKSVLVFSRTKHGADKIAGRLRDNGYKVGVLHSNRSQNQRQRAMEDFREWRTQLLVATDIAARGIDIKNISHVVNFDVPRQREDYVHRVGRTARHYGVGDAITLVDPTEESDLKEIERFIHVEFPRATVPNFQYNRAPRVFPVRQQHRNPHPQKHHPQHQHGQHKHQQRPQHPPHHQQPGQHQQHPQHPQGQQKHPQRPQHPFRHQQPGQHQQHGLQNRQQRPQHPPHHQQPGQHQQHPQHPHGQQRHQQHPQHPSHQQQGQHYQHPRQKPNRYSPQKQYQHPQQHQGPSGQKNRHGHSQQQHPQHQNPRQEQHGHPQKDQRTRYERNRRFRRY